jgi:hypothetical protein
MIAPAANTPLAHSTTGWGNKRIATAKQAIVPTPRDNRHFQLLVTAQMSPWNRGVVARTTRSLRFDGVRISQKRTATIVE